MLLLALRVSGPPVASNEGNKQSILKPQVRSSRRTNKPNQVQRYVNGRSTQWINTEARGQGDSQMVRRQWINTEAGGQGDSQMVRRQWMSDRGTGGQGASQMVRRQWMSELLCTGIEEARFPVVRICPAGPRWV